MKSVLHGGQTVLVTLCKLLQSYPEVMGSIGDRVTAILTACTTLSNQADLRSELFRGVNEQKSDSWVFSRSAEILTGTLHRVCRFPS
jgi:hypothetical protein